MKQLLRAVGRVHCPVRLLWGVLAVAVISGGCAGSGSGEHAFTRVFVVRHAEKQAGIEDPGLTSAGAARAGALAELCAREGVVAVYTSQYRRTRETGAVAAARVGAAVDASYPAGEEARLAAHVLCAHAGERVLVVGHSNTVGRVVEGLGAERPADLDEGVYDALFVVTIGPSGRVWLERRRYGAPSR